MRLLKAYDHLKLDLGNQRLLIPFSLSMEDDGADTNQIEVAPSPPQSSQ